MSGMQRDSRWVALAAIVTFAAVGSWAQHAEWVTFPFTGVGSYFLAPTLAMRVAEIAWLLVVATTVALAIAMFVRKAVVPHAALALGGGGAFAFVATAIAITQVWRLDQVPITWEEGAYDGTTLYHMTGTADRFSISGAGWLAIVCSIGIAAAGLWLRRITRAPQPV
jgi:hypothetical protein